MYRNCPAPWILRPPPSTSKFGPPGGGWKKEKRNFPAGTPKKGLIEMRSTCTRVSLVCCYLKLQVLLSQVVPILTRCKIPRCISVVNTLYKKGLRGGIVLYIYIYINIRISARCPPRASERHFRQKASYFRKRALYL